MSHLSVKERSSSHLHSCRCRCEIYNVKGHVQACRARVFELCPVWSLPSGLRLCLWIWNPVRPAIQFSSLGGCRWHSGRGPLAEVGRPGARVISCLVSLTAVEHGVCCLAAHQQGALWAQNYTRDQAK